MDRFEFFKKCAAVYRTDPAAFFREVLCFEPDPWQAAAANDVAHYPKVSVRSGQGVGKTGLQAALLLWFLTCFPFSRVVATAPSRQQLCDVLWAETAKWLAASPLLSDILKWSKTRICVAGMENRWFATPRTAVRPENMQGFHADNMLFIVDEASGVADPIMEAILGTLSGENNKLLLCGNPTKTSGTFFDSHNADIKLYKTHKVSSLGSTRTNKDNIDSLIRRFGRDSNVVRVRVLGEFPVDEDDVFIPTALVENAVFTGRESDIDTIDIGVDVARFGTDSTVIAAKAGRCILPLIVKNGADTSQTAEETVSLARRLRADFGYEGTVRVKIDDTGVGGGVTDSINKIKRLDEELSWLKVVPVSFASAVSHPYYHDFNTYLWGNFKDMLEAGEILLPDDDELRGELTSRKKGFSTKGKIKIESKDEMKKRGLPSPDRADAAALAALPVTGGGGNRRQGKRRV